MAPPRVKYDDRIFYQIIKNLALQVGTTVIDDIIPAGSEAVKTTINISHDFDLAIFVVLDVFNVLEVGCSRS